jgi:hypothetical protein
MTLTSEQKQALQRGEVVETTVDGMACVLLSREVFGRLQKLHYDDSEMDPREAYPSILKAWDSQGCPEDATDYQ